MYRIAATIFFLTLLYPAIAQQMPQGNRGGGGGQNMNAGHFYGRIVDGKNGKGVDGATLQLTGNKFDTVTKKMKNAILATVFSAPNGDFSLESIPVMGSFSLRITAIGYGDTTLPVSFGIDFKKAGDNSNPQDRMQQIMGMIDKDLGNIKLAVSDNTLSTVTVTAASKPFFEMGVDRKIFNVDKNIVSQGQTATEVMKQIPGLNVDIDGNVTMRNASPQLFIDGRPTTLTMDQIPAEIIDKVELITNPSAKYDASGGNAGILNIVLKKNVKTGYNGGIRAGIDSRGKFNGGGDFNFRQNKVNFFLSGTYNQRKSKYTAETFRNNFTDPVGSVHLNDVGSNVGYFAFVRGGLDYLIDNRNTLSFAGNYNRGNFKTTSNQVIDSTIENVFASYSNRDAFTEFNFTNYGGQMSFRHNFAKNGHDITADVNYNSSKNDNVSDFTTSTFLPDNSPKSLPLLQHTAGNGYNRFITIQTDYENTFSEKSKLELGARAAIRDYKNESRQLFYDYSTGEYLLIPSISSNYKFTDAVYAAYGTYTLKTKEWNYQFGLRTESSNYDGTLLGKDSSFNVKFPFSIFPSAFITHHLNDKEDIQLNYARKINRPGFFQLLPFVDYTDPQNLNIGNPNLKPEFTNSFELSYNKSYPHNSNFLATAYFRYTTDLITRFQYVDANPVKTDTAIGNGSDTAIFNTFANANSSVSYGLELTNRTTIAKIWDVTLNVNFYNAKINAENLGDDLSNERVSWFAKWNNTVRLPKKYSVQLSASYQAKTVLPATGSGGGGGGGRGGGGFGGGFGGGNISTSQGFIYPIYSFDIAIKKDWSWKGGNTASLTISMNDFLRTALSKTYSETDYFNQVYIRRRDPQVLRVNFSYRFGKIDASLFKRKNTRADQGGGMDNMGGQ